MDNMSEDENERDDDEGTSLMSKGELRKAPTEVTEKYMLYAFGAILQRNFAHNIGWHIIQSS